MKVDRRRQSESYRNTTRHTGLHFRECEQSAYPKIIGQNGEGTFRDFAYLQKDGTGMEDARRSIANKYKEWLKANGQ